MTTSPPIPRGASDGAFALHENNMTVPAKIVFIVHEVDVTERTVALLDRLRAEIERETGRSLSREELVDLIVQRAAENRSETVDLFRGES